MAIFGIIAFGEATGDCLWYGLGRTLRNTKFGNWVKNHLPGHDRAHDALQKKGRRYLYLSKFAYGSAGLVTFSLGWTGMPFRTFLKNSLMSVVVALPVVFFLAYGIFSGLSPLTAVDQFKHIERIVLVGIVAFLALEYLISRVMKYLLKNGNGNGTGSRAESRENSLRCSFSRLAAGLLLTSPNFELY